MKNFIKKKFYTPLMPKLHLVISDIAKTNKKLFYYIRIQQFKRDTLLEFIAKKVKQQHKQFDLDYSTIYSYVIFLDSRMFKYVSFDITMSINTLGSIFRI